jgi:N-acetylmuramoyl-L-alanine amidase
MRYLSIVSIFIVSLLLSAHQPYESGDFHLKTVVIDPGHGGKDPGCLSSGIKEKEIVLKVALELGRIIEENMKNVRIVYTRKTDVFVELHERANIANKNNAHVFVSIHVNADGSARTNGTETFTMGIHKNTANLEVAKRENAVVTLEDNYLEKYDGFDPNSPESHIIFSLFQNAYLEQSLSLAVKIEDQFANRVQRKSRGVKQAGFLVLWRTSMPSVLVELGFLTNPAERNFLSSTDGQVYMASAIYRALKDYKEELESMN